MATKYEFDSNDGDDILIVGDGSIMITKTITRLRLGGCILFKNPKYFGRTDLQIFWPKNDTQWATLGSLPAI